MFVRLFTGTAMILATSSAMAAEPIYIQPGQCILVGGQQVCAQVQAQGGAVPVKSDILYVCRFGEFKDSETPEMKSFALFQIRVNDRGTKVETYIKNFGMNGKDACEREIAEKQKS